MSLLLDIARPPTLFDAAVQEPAVPAAETSTLAASIQSAWSEISAGRPAACPVCAAPMVPVYGAGALPLGGRCDGCGTRFA